MMIFQDTPNPNAKKIDIKHNFELGINLSEEEILVDSELNFFLNHEGIKNIFNKTKGHGFSDFYTKKLKFIVSNLKWQNLLNYQKIT